MNKKEQLDLMLHEAKGVLKTADAVSAGISKAYFLNYVKTASLERVAQGIYLSQDAWPDALYLLQAQYPQVIFSHETALYLLKLADREPLQFTVTVKSGYHAKSLTQQNVCVYQVKAERYPLGVTELHTPFGHCVKAYNAERTICDVIRSRSQIEKQDMTTALKEYVRKNDKNVPLLMRYASELKIERILRQYLEVLL